MPRSDQGFRSKPGYLRASQPLRLPRGSSVNFHQNFGGWTLVFALLISAVICDALGIWAGWLSPH